ncbi:MAG: TldD/PmbA family protein [Candidatus Geothermarchaeales archaeon]
MLYLDEELALSVIDQALMLGADYVEARFHEKRAETIALKDGELEPIVRHMERGVATRVLVDGAMGLATTNLVTEASVSDAVERAVKLGKAASRLIDEKIEFSPVETYDVEYTAVEKRRWVNTDLDEKIGLLRDIDRRLEDGSKLKIGFPSRLLELNHVWEKKLLVNSTGTSVLSAIPRTGAHYMLTGAAEGKTIQRMGQIGGAVGWEIMEDRDLEGTIASDAKAMETMLLKGTSPPEEDIDVVVAPEVSGIIVHEAVGHPSEADRILGREAAQAGESYMEPDSLGRRIGSEATFVSDDPTIPGSYGYYLYDDEGVKAGRRVLIEEGGIKSFLHNRQTAAELNVESNGSARAMSYSVEPIVRMANTYFEAGDFAFSELLEGIHLGVYVKSFMEWNIDDKRVNQRYTGLESYMIRDGELAEPVRSAMIETTTEELLGKLDARGNDLQFWAATCGKGDPSQGAPCWAGGPHLRFRGIRLGIR